MWSRGPGLWNQAWFVFSFSFVVSGILIVGSIALWSPRG